MRALSDLQVHLHAANGIVWDLLHPLSPVQIVGGLGGLHLPGIEPHVSTSAAVPGQRRRGKSIKPRPVPMQLLVGDPSQVGRPRIQQEWRNLDATFWEGLPIGGPAVTLQVGDRHIDLVLEDAQPTLAEEPGIRGRQVYDVEFVADRPFWRGEEKTFTFTYDPGVIENYYGGPSGGGFGPPLHISSSSALEGAAVANDGDEEAWLRWAVTGPGNVTVGIGDDLVALPLTLAAGDQVFIDTDPRSQTVVDGTGRNLWPYMGGSRVRFAPVPPASSVPVVVIMEQATLGAVAVAALTPEYHRAWGRVA